MFHEPTPGFRWFNQLKFDDGFSLQFGYTPLGAATLTNSAPTESVSYPVLSLDLFRRLLDLAYAGRHHDYIKMTTEEDLVQRIQRTESLKLADHTLAEAMEIQRLTATSTHQQAVVGGNEPRPEPTPSERPWSFRYNILYYRGQLFAYLRPPLGQTLLPDDKVAQLLTALNLEAELVTLGTDTLTSKPADALPVESGPGTNETIPGNESTAREAAALDTIAREKQGRYVDVRLWTPEPGGSACETAAGTLEEAINYIRENHKFYANWRLELISRPNP